MTQKTDPFIQLNWGWDDGENGWGSGMNENLIVTAFLHNRRLDNILADGSMLPPSPVDGSAYFVNSDKNVYLRAEGQWYNILPPVGMTFVKKTDESVVKYNGTALVTDTKTISEVTGLQAALDAKVDDSQVGAINGVAPLGADGKVPAINLPLSDSYLGTWNATTNSPTIVSSTGTQGQYYEVTVGGSTTIDGISSWVIGDKIKFNGTVWQKIPNTATVSSVNGYVGAVALTNTDVGAAATIHTHSNATTSVAGFMSSVDKTKLDGVATGATANSSDATLLSRSNHTGTQTASTISDLTEAVQDVLGSTLVAGSNITLSYNDVANTLTINSTASGGSSTFLGLTDTPSAYTSQANKAVRVNAGETALEFVSLGTAAFNNTGDFANASHTHSNATTSVAGFMSSTDKTKLDSFTGTFTSALESKLNGIASGAEVNVNADWSSVSGDSQILNKPTLAAIATSGSATDLTSGTIDNSRISTTIDSKNFTNVGAFSTNVSSGSQLVCNLDGYGSGGGWARSYPQIRLSGTDVAGAGWLGNNTGVSTYGIGFGSEWYGGGNKFRIFPSGNVGIGANLADSGHKLRVDGDVSTASITSTRAVIVRDVGANPVYYNGHLELNNNGSGNPVSLSFHRSGSTAVNIVHDSGNNLRLDGTSWNDQNGNLLLNSLTASGTISGNGSGLTTLNASNLSSGTVADARLPTTMVSKILPAATLTSNPLIENTPLVWRDTVNPTTSMGQYVSFRDFTATEVAWLGFGTGNGEMGFSNSSRNIRFFSPVVLNSTITGNGSGLTSLDASNLSSGTVPDARLSSNIMRKDTPSQKFQSLGTVSGSVSITAASGMHVLATVNGNTTWTFPSPSASEAHALTLELTNGGAFAMTWPAGTRWAGGVAPTLTASGTDILVFTKAGTNNWRGYLSSKDNK